MRCVRCDAAARKSSGALECEYSSRKWCSTSHAQSMPIRSASSICSSASAKTRASSPSVPRARHLMLEEQPESHAFLRSPAGRRTVTSRCNNPARREGVRGGTQRPHERATRRGRCSSTPTRESSRRCAPTGAPISLPVWFVALDRRIYVAGPAHTKKFARIRNDPRVAFVVESGTHWAELVGVHLTGRAGCRRRRRATRPGHGRARREVRTRFARPARRCRRRPEPTTKPGPRRSRSCPTIGSCRGTTPGCSRRSRHDRRRRRRDAGPDATPRTTGGDHRRRGAPRSRRGGYAATSMADVAAATGVSHLIVYRHFDSKEELYEAVLERALELLAEALCGRAGGRQLRPDARGVARRGACRSLGVRGALAARGP